MNPKHGFLHLGLLTPNFLSWKRFCAARLGAPAWIAWLLACVVLLAAAQPIRAEQFWVLIDTEAAVLKVMAGKKVIARYDNISIGRMGTADLHLLGDDTTPLGAYRINAIGRNASYELFLGLDYPTVAHAKLALGRQVIDEFDYEDIVEAHERGAPPPASTPLGGEIGIHGIGRGSLRMHREYNWTHGCVALDNRQIRDLASTVRIGTRVVIR